MSKVTLARWAKRSCLLLVVYCVVFAQTQVNLSTQSKNADFSAFLRTKPAKVGASLPSTCGVGELFFSTSATPGQNLYACYLQNQWTTVGGSAGALTAGGSGALCIGTGCSGGTPTTIDVVTSVVPLLAAANTFTGVNKFQQLQTNINSVATLPPCNATFEGQMESVNDAVSPSYLGTVTGGGSAHVPVYCNGTSWVAH